MTRTTITKQKEQVTSSLTDAKEYFKTENIVLYHGDVLNASFFTTPFIDLIVTSPPYNVGIDYCSNNDDLSYREYLDFSRKWLTNCYYWSNTSSEIYFEYSIRQKQGRTKKYGGRFDDYCPGSRLENIIRL